MKISMKGIKIMIKSLNLIFLLFMFVSYISAKNPPIEINVQLKTDQDIERAMQELKNSAPKSYKILIELKKTNKDEFKSRLYNHYYIHLHKKELEKRYPNPKEGYRTLAKESDRAIEQLSEKYKASDNRAEIERQMEDEAVKRYHIELDFLVMKSQQEQNDSEDEIKKIEEFKKNKDRFIGRMLNKMKRSDS